MRILCIVSSVPQIWPHSGVRITKNIVATFYGNSYLVSNKCDVRILRLALLKYLKKITNFEWSMVDAISPCPNGHQTHLTHLTRPILIIRLLGPVRPSSKPKSRQEGKRISLWLCPLEISLLLRMYNVHCTYIRIHRSSRRDTLGSSDATKTLRVCSV